MVPSYSAASTPSNLQHRWVDIPNHRSKMRLRSSIELKQNSWNGSRRRPFRAIIVLAIFATSLVFILMKPALNLGLSLSERVFQQTSDLNETRVFQITDKNRQMIYLHKPDIMFMTLAKAGSSSLWHWLYRGVTGHQRWDGRVCNRHVHDKTSNCWEGHASYMYMLPPLEQMQILTSPDTLRVALQREPYERIISAYKSKFTCEHQRFSTDVHERDHLVSVLRKWAHLPAGPSCMNVSEFALALHLCRENVGKPGFPPSLQILDDHIRPQEFYLDEIEYDLVIDVKHLSDVDVLKPIIDRLEFKQLIEDGVNPRHGSGSEKLLIPEDAAAMLHGYALESKQAPIKIYSSNESLSNY